MIPPFSCSTAERWEYLSYVWIHILLASKSTQALHRPSWNNGKRILYRSLCSSRMMEENRVEQFFFDCWPWKFCCTAKNSTQPSSECSLKNSTLSGLHSPLWPSSHSSMRNRYDETIKQDHSVLISVGLILFIGQRFLFWTSIQECTRMSSFLSLVLFCPLLEELSHIRETVTVISEERCSHAGMNRRRVTINYKRYI